MLCSSAARKPAVRRLLLILLAGLLATAGCARVEKKKQQTGFEETAQAYGEALRWSHQETAYRYLHSSVRPRPEEEKTLENVQILGYEVIDSPRVRLDRDPPRAEQEVRISYALRDRPTVRKLSHRQDWRFDANTETWWLHTPLPEFR